MSEPCKFEDVIREVHGDVKVIASEFKAMNGSLRNIKEDFEKHKEESKTYRWRNDVVWTVIHTVKYIFIGLFGSGLIWKAWEAFKK